MAMTAPAPTAIHIGADDLPFVDIGDGSKLKVIQVKEKEGLWIVENIFNAGYVVPTHKHTGPVWGYTRSGAWKYKEYDYVNREGSFLYEPPHELFAELRRTQPVFWQDIPGKRGYWAVLTYKDLVTVAKRPQLFSASEGGIIVEDLDPDQLEMMRMMLLSMDPPKHRDYRRPLAQSFHARVIAGLADQVRAITREILGRAAAME